MAVVNIVLLSACTFIIGFIVGLILLDQKKEDFEDNEVGQCGKTKHVFKHDDRVSQVYCLCGNESIRSNEAHTLYVIKG